MFANTADSKAHADSNWRDTLRQVLNVATALSQIVITALLYATSSESSFTSNDTDSSTPIVPASYAFVVWSIIYGGSLLYSIYQALPRQRDNALFRSIGYFTASAFVATSCWLITASQRWLWLTLACMFWILASTIGAFIQFIRFNAPRNNKERFLVVLPISIFAAWATVAAVVNTSTTLRNSGVKDLFGLADQYWAVIILIVAGAIAGFAIFKSRGNVWYAGTIVWALVGIVVANLTRETLPAVAVTAGIMAAIELGILWFSRTSGGNLFGNRQPSANLSA